MGRSDPKPFEQLRYGDLPDSPRLEHAFADSEGIDLQLDSSSFGKMGVHVRKHGAGPPLLLIHGLMTSSYSWRYVYRELGEHFTCYAPDLPACGRSEAVLGVAYSPANLSRWLIEVQRALGVYGCAAIGNSMGGYLAMVTALADPNAMCRLVNLHSPGVAEPRLWLLKAALAAPGSSALLRWLVRRKPTEWVHRHIHYYDETLKSLEEAREYGGTLAGFAGAQGLVKYLRETMSVTQMRRFEAALRRRRRQSKPFPIPLLLAYAERDPMVPARIGDALAALIPSAEFVRLAHASHFAHVDAPERFLPPALEFLARG